MYHGCRRSARVPAEKNHHLFIMLDVKSLSCRRNGRLVFREVGFRLAPGGLLQITGANGSGKSSLLRVLAGLLPSAGGEILWQGKAIGEDIEAHRARLQYIGHLDALKPELTGDEMVDYWRVLRTQSGLACGDAFGIDAFRQKSIRVLSAGQKRRLSLSRLMLGGALLWLLDEPATALDGEGQKLLLAQIATHRAKGGMVIAAVHQHLNTDGQVFTMAEAK
jgi:heme exporter protein A